MTLQPARKPSKIALLGFMGAGKSTVAPLLASQLDMECLELDALLLQSSAFPSIPAMFEALGEQGFRDCESALTSSLSESRNVVISTGGGIIERPRNIHALKQNDGVCVLLQSTFAEILRRIPQRATRPLLRDIVQAERLYKKRQPLYQHYADIIVETEGKSVEDVCSDIIVRLE